MLLSYKQFQLAQGVRTPIQLLNPPIIDVDQFNPPRESVFHYLDMDKKIRFPERDIPYLSNIPPNKRIPTTHVLDTVTQDEVASVADRTLLKQIREWREANTRGFRLVDLREEPNGDIQTNAIVNYNLLKTLHKYQGTSTSHHSRQMNIYRTVWSTVNQMADKSPNENQFVRLVVPTLIPSAAAIHALLNRKLATYARVITNVHLNNAIQLFMYLSEKTRDRSSMASLSLANTERVTIELTFKGHSCFFKLSDLVGMCDENDLPVKVKYPVNKVERILIVMLLRFQAAVTALIEAQEVPEVPPPDLSDQFPDPTDPDFDETDDRSRSTGNPVQGEQSPQSSSTPYKVMAGVKAPDPVKPPDLSQFEELSETTLDTMIDKGMEDVAGVTDDIFMKSIQSAMKQETEEAESSGESEDTGPHLRLDYSPEANATALDDVPPEKAYADYLEEAKGSGAVATSEIRNLRKMVEARKTLKSPYTGELLDTEKVVTSEMLELHKENFRIPIDNDLVPDHLKTEELFNADKLYLNTVMKKDVIASVSHLEKAGVIIKGYEVERVTDAVGRYDVHKLTLRPLSGKESQVYFRLPVIDDEGEFVASGVRLRMRKQETELPIRKISPTRVALTTNYGKLFVQRTERRAYDKHRQITERVKRDYLDQTGSIRKIIPGNTFVSTDVVPNAFAVMSQEFKQIITDDYVLSFDPAEARNQLDDTTWTAVHGYSRSEPEKRLIYCGYRKDKRILVMDLNSNVFLFSKDRNHEPLGQIEDLLGMDTTKLPKQFSIIKVLGDSIALGPVLAYYLGLSRLISVTGAKVTLLEPRKQYQPTRQDVVIRFDNAKLVVHTQTEEQMLLFSGFLFYKDITKLYPIESFDLKEVYLELIEHWGGSVMHIKELDILRQLFVDPISADKLKIMREPHEYLKLLMRANNMLSDYSHEDANDPKYVAIRSYDRVPGLMYRALANAVRQHKIRGNGRGKIELDPYEVWNAVTRDTTVKITEDCNPVLDVKEVESVTLSGADGLNKGATPEGLRRYHPNDAGLISESTVDSGDVGLNFFLTPYAKISNLRGMVDQNSHEHIQHPEKIFSTSVQLAPMSEYDDPKRIN